MTDIQMVRLGDLAPDPVAIAGQEQRLARLDDLLASIPAKGVLQSLRVRPWDPARVVEAEGRKGKKGKKAAAAEPQPLYGVIAGNRRLATLRRLCAEGGSIKGEAVTADMLVPVLVGDEDDADAYEITSAENLLRLPLTPVEEFRAYQKMAAEASPKEIAARFGVPEKRVRQRLRLAQLHPEVLQALEAGKIGMAAAEAFTLADPDCQATYLRKSSSWQLDAQNVRAAFTDQLVRSDSPIAKLIGKKAYVEAGGQILADDFGNVGYWISPEIIAGLVEARWAEQKAAWLAEGWLFAETVDEFGTDRYGSYLVLGYSTKKLEPEPLPLGDALAAEVAELEATIAAIRGKHPELSDDYWGESEEEEEDSPELEAAEAELKAQDARLRQIRREAPVAFAAEQKAVSGVVYWPGGQREPTFGVVRPGTKVPGEAGETGGGRTGKAPATLALPGDARMADLSRQVTAALRQKVAGMPVAALQILVAALHVSWTQGYGAPVEIRGAKRSSDVDFSARGYDIAGNSRPLGMGFAGALDWAAKQDIPGLLVYLAELVGPNVGVERQSGGFAEHERAIIDFVDPGFPGFDAEAYFAGVSKPVVVEAWNEMHLAVTQLRGQATESGDPAPAIPPFSPAGKKGDMAAAAAAAARLTGWLPPQLRTPSYAGPGPKAAETEGEAAGAGAGADEDGEREAAE
jgi:ParB family chromosome partitioning protein